MKKSIFVMLLSAIILFGCQQQIKTGIAGNDNDNNRVVVADNSNITINDKPKTIMESQIVPEDILKKIYPGVSVNFATELLGQAKINYLGKIGSAVDQSLRSADFYIWHFNNVFIQITSEDNQSISTITLMKRAMAQPDTFTIYPFTKFKIGVLKYSDVSENCESPQEDYSSKFYSMKTECYFGNPGNYWSFEFGLYEGGGASYNQSFNDNINAGPFNYVSIGREKNDTSSVFFGDLR